MYPSIFTDELGMDIVQGLPIIKSWGLNHVDLRGRVFGKAAENLEPELLPELRQLLDTHGMKVGCLESSLAKVHLPDAERCRQEEQKLERLIRLADAVDCRLVRTFHYWQPKGDDRGQLVVRPDELQTVLDLYAPLAERAKAEGLIMAFENCGVTVAEALTVIDALGIPSWGLAWDLSNGWNCPERETDQDGFFRRTAKRTRVVHVKARGSVEGLGGFTVPYDQVLQICDAAGLDGPVSAETHNPDRSVTNEEMSHRVVQVILNSWPTAAPGAFNIKAVEERQERRDWADDPVGFAVIGLGMGHNRAGIVHKTSGTRLVGVCDLVEQRAERTGKEFGAPYNTNYHEWLEDDEVEVVYVMTETGNHAQVALDAMEAGKHVITTKPMEASLAKADAMVAKAKQKGVLFAVDFGKRFSTENQTLRAAVKNGFFGKLLGGMTTTLIRRTDEYYAVNGGWHGTIELDGGGVFSNQAIHEIDYLASTLGLPERVRCSVWTKNHAIEGEDLGAATWEYSNGLVINFNATTCFPQGTWYTRTDIFGSEGAYYNVSGGPYEQARSGWYFDGAWQDQPRDVVKSEWLNAADNMAAAIRTGANLTCPGESGRATQSILDAMYRSGRENDGGWVKLIPPDQ